MTVSEAKTIVDRFHQNNGDYSEDELFLYTEAAQFLIRETGDPFYMMALGGQYYDMKNYDLALKYYEMAAKLGNDNAKIGLGYIWYYGRTGTVDYEKAFKYFSEVKDDFNARYKIADMYHYGYYVEKNEVKYREIIEDLYKNYNYDRDEWNEASICLRLAEIREEDGNIDEAIDLLYDAEASLKMSLFYHQFFGAYSLMQRIIDKLYSLKVLDMDGLDLYDLYELFKKPAKVKLTYEDKEYIMESFEEEDGTISVLFDGKWYRNVNDMMMNASIAGLNMAQAAACIDEIEVI